MLSTKNQQRVFEVMQHAVREIGISSEKLEYDSSFVADLNLDSLQFLELIELLERRFGVELELDRLSSHQTVGAAAAYITTTLGQNEYCDERE